jgi:glyoxylase-like metal-dependent hydrolase (beta-lactamase superfamily II)
MRVHHLNCGSLCPRGARLINGEGGLLDRGLLSCHCLLIEASTGLVLIDTGFGMEDAHDPRRLGAEVLMGARAAVETTALRQVEALGFDAGDVRHIVATHLDPDHTGGLPDFPAAEVHVFAPELEAALDPKLDERLRYRDVHWKHGPQWVAHRSDGGDRWFGFESVRILSGVGAELALVPLVGHSRGHTAVAVGNGDGWLLHCGDAYFNRGEVARPPSCPPMLRFFQNLTAADRRARKSNLERLRDLAAKHGDDVTLFCSHDPHELEREQAKPAAGAAAAG